MVENFLILRPKNQAEDLIEVLEAKNQKYFVEPIFSVENIVVKIEGNKIQAAIITSFNAVLGFLSANFKKDLKVFVLSEKIARKLNENGYENVEICREQNSQSLKNLILSKKLSENEKILYFCGNYITSDFSEILQEKNLCCEKILSYKIQYHDFFSQEFLHEIKNEKFDYVLCYSKNSVKNFVDLIKKHNLVEYFDKCKIIGFSENIVGEIRKNNFKNFDNFNSIEILKNFYNL